MKSGNGQGTQHYKTIKLPPRRKMYGRDYEKRQQLCMTGKEWHQYAKRDSFKTERGSDSAWGNSVEVYVDGKPMESQ